MSKLGFMQDLIRGIKKTAKADEPKATVKETVVVGSSNANTAPVSYTHLTLPTRSDV